MSKFIVAFSLVFFLMPAFAAESAIEAQERQLLVMKQKLVEMKARLKDGSPEIEELDKLVQSQEAFVSEVRRATHKDLSVKLSMVEEQLHQLRAGKIQADPVREALLEQARGTIIRRLLENQIGFDLDKDLPGLAGAANDAAADAVRNGAISFKLPDNADIAAVDQLRKNIAHIAPNVELNYLEQFRVMTATGGDAVQLRRVQGLASALKTEGTFQRGGGNVFVREFQNQGGPPMPFNGQNNQGGPGGDRQMNNGMRPPRPPEMNEEKKPQEKAVDKF